MSSNNSVSQITISLSIETVIGLLHDIPLVLQNMESHAFRALLSTIGHVDYVSQPPIQSSRAAQRLAPPPDLSYSGQEFEGRITRSKRKNLSHQMGEASSGQAPPVCCRNGKKVVLLIPSKHKRVRHSGDVEMEVDDVGGEEEEEEEEENDSTSPSKGEKVRNEEIFRSDGRPPAIEAEAKFLFFQLAGVIYKPKAVALSNFLCQLISADPSLVMSVASSQDALTVKGLYRRCVQFESTHAVNDFYHMITLIQLAFNVERMKKEKKTNSLTELANFLGLYDSYNTFWQYYSQGSRLIHIAAAGTPYILLIIAALNMKSSIMSRQSGTHSYVITSLAKALRSSEDPLLNHLVKTVLVPSIVKLRQVPLLSSVLQYTLFPSTPSTPSIVLNFSDISSCDSILDTFVTNTFYLPPRSEAWLPLLATSLPTSYLSILPPIPSLSSPFPSVTFITLPFGLDEVEKPDLTPRSRSQWTAQKRIECQSRVEVNSIHDLQSTVNNTIPRGLDSQYVYIGESALKDNFIKIVDSKGSLVGLILGNSPIIKDRLTRLQNIMQSLIPQTFSSCDSTRPGYTFTSIHCDTYNRFAEKGDGAPPDVHPDNIYREGKSKVNHSQRTPHASEAIRKNPEQYKLMVDAVQDICEVISYAILQQLPELHPKLSLFCDLLVLNDPPPTYPFPGFVLNIQVCTDGHHDSNDDTICVVLPFGSWIGGEVVLEEAALILQMQQGDGLFFYSAEITHFNLHFNGVRGSLVLHSDKQAKSWVNGRNGWQAHMAT